MTTIPNLLAIYDEITILDCLSDHKQTFKNFTTNQVAGFYVDEDYYLVIYLANAEETIRFRMYIIKDFSVNVETLGQIADVLTEQVADNYYPYLMEQAKGKILDVMHMAETFRVFYGKTLDED